MDMVKKQQPTKVLKYFCPVCGELMAKIYPWASLQVNGPLTPCNKCLNGVAAGKLRYDLPSLGYKKKK